jgi:hypothetical protein
MSTTRAGMSASVKLALAARGATPDNLERGEKWKEDLLLSSGEGTKNISTMCERWRWGQELY